MLTELVKKEDVSWDQNIKVIKNHRKEMEELGLVILNVIYWVALSTCSNLVKRQSDVAKNNSGNEQFDPTILEHTMRRFTATSEQTVGDIIYMRTSNRSRRGGKSKGRLNRNTLKCYNCGIERNFAKDCRTPRQHKVETMEGQKLD